MATTEELIVTARWQGQQLEAGARAAQAEMGKLSQAATVAMRAFGALGVAFSAKQVLDYAEGWTKVTNQLRLVSQNAEQTRTALVKVATDTGANLQSTVTLYTRLTRATRDLGVSEQQRLAAVKTINQTMALSGATAQETAAALLQLSQAFSSNRLAGEEFRAVAEQAPMLLDIFAESLGVTRGQLREMAMEGKITGEVMLTALAGAAAETERQFAKMDMTMGRALENLQTKLMEAIGLTNEQAGATKNLAQAVNGLAQVLPYLAKGLDGMVQFFLMYQTVSKLLDPLFNAIDRGTGWFTARDLQNQKMWEGYKMGPESPSAAEIDKAAREREQQERIGRALASYRATVAAFGNDDAQEVLKLQEQFAKELAQAAKDGYGPEQIAQLKAYQAALLALTVAQQEAEAAAKAQTEAEKAATQAKRKAAEAAREMAEFDRVVAQASRERAQKDADHRRDVATGQEMVARSAEELSQARMTENQRILRQFDLETQLGAKTAMLADDTGKLAVQYAQNRWHLRQLIEAEQEKEDVDKKALDRLAAWLAAIDMATQGLQRVLGMGAASELAGIAGGVGKSFAMKTTDPNAFKLGMAGAALSGFGMVVDAFRKSSEEAKAAAAAAAARVRELARAALSLAEQAPGEEFKRAQDLLMAPLRAVYEGILALSPATTELGKAQASVEALNDLMTTLGAVDLYAKVRPLLQQAADLANHGMGQAAQGVIRQIEQLVGMSMDDYRAFLADQGPMLDAVIAQVQAQTGLSWSQYMASISSLFGDEGLVSAATQMFSAADAVDDLADSVDGLDEAAQRAVRATFDLREMMLRQQAASAFQGSGGNLGAQAAIYRTLYGQIEGLATAERATMGAQTATTSGVVVTPGGGGTGGGTTNGGMTQIEVDAGYFSALLAQIPGQIQAALDLAFADWSALGLSEEQIAKLRSVTDPLAQARDLYDGSFAGIDPLDIPQSAFDAIGKATEALTKVNDRLRALGIELPGFGADAAASGQVLSDALAHQLWDAAANAMEWTRTRQELADYMNGARRGEVVSDTAKAEIRAAAENALEWVRNAQQLAEYMNGSRRGEAMSDTLRNELVASVQESMEWTRDRANLATYMAGQRRGEAVSEVIYAGLEDAVDAALAFGDVNALTQLAEQAQFTGIGSQVATFIGDQIKQMYRDTKDQIEGLLGGDGVTPSAVVEIKPSVNVSSAAVEAAIAEALRGIPLQDIVDGAMPIAGVDLADLVRIKSADLAETITVAVNEAFRNRKLKVPSSAVRTG